MVDIMKAERFESNGQNPMNTVNASNTQGMSRGPMHPNLGPHQHHGHHASPVNNTAATTTSMGSANHQGSPLQRPPSTIHHQGVQQAQQQAQQQQQQQQQFHSNGAAVNGVATVNGQPPNPGIEGDSDNEKWWWVCCLEFCFCLL